MSQGSNGLAHSMKTAERPPVTHAHLRAAFEAMRWPRWTFEAMRWPRWTFEAAMAVEIRRRLIEIRAAQLRNQEWARETRVTRVPVRRCVLGADGHPVRWCTQMVAGPAVAGDLLTPLTGATAP